MLPKADAVITVSLFPFRRPRQAGGRDAAAAPVRGAEGHLRPAPHQPPQQRVCAPGNRKPHIPAKHQSGSERRRRGSPLHFNELLMHIKSRTFLSENLSLSLPHFTHFLFSCDSSFSPCVLSFLFLASLCCAQPESSHSDPSLFLCQFNHFSHFKMTLPQFYRSSCLSLPVSTRPPPHHAATASLLTPTSLIIYCMGHVF